MADLRLSSPAFDDGEPIPTKHTCEGKDASPPLTIQGVPEQAASLVLIVDDPDAPRPEPWVHWLVWNLPADTSEIPEASLPGAASQGTNDFDDQGYGGPCPPPGHGTHTYRFLLWALDEELDVPEGAPRAELEKAMQGRTLDQAKLTGTFER